MYYILMNTLILVMNSSQQTHRGQLKQLASFSALENVTDPVSAQREKGNRSIGT
tara:strand:+ start:465 stop:626 length:162 start_codon:yes stop_codon:yes gene_type:complete